MTSEVYVGTGADLNMLVVWGVVCVCGGGGGGRVRAQISAFGNRCISLFSVMFFESCDVMLHASIL